MIRRIMGKKKRQTRHLLMTLVSTGIQVSELRFVTVESLAAGQTEID